MSSEDGHVATGEGAPPPAVPESAPTNTSHSTARRGETYLPLNSLRLTNLYLKAIARSIGLPISGSADETRVMIDRKLEEMGRNPRDIQVVVVCDARGQEAMSLRDVDGEFIHVGKVVECEGAGGEAAREGEEREESGSTTSDPGGRDSTGKLDELREENARLSTLNEDLTAQVSSLRTEVDGVRDKLQREKEYVREVWRASCTQLVGFDETITARDSEIARLKARITELEVGRPVSSTPTVLPLEPASEPLAHFTHTPHVHTHTRRGKAPPVNEFSGEDPESLLEDWLPSLERASTWNAWSEEEKLIQFAGHLRGGALQEWNLLQPYQRSTFSKATEALCSQLDSASKSVAAQDFRHMAQHESESVSDFIRRLERTFRAAYGRDPMSLETRETLLHGQLQDGLPLQLLRGPAVSGARTYQELCVAAKNEEKRLFELKKRQEYSKLHSDSTTRGQGSRQGKPRQTSDSSDNNSQTNTTQANTSQATSRPPLKCFYCDKPGHRREECRKRKRDMEKKSESQSPSKPAAKKVTADGKDSANSRSPSGPLDTQQDPVPAPSYESETSPLSLATNQPSTPASAPAQSSDEPTPLQLLFSDSEDDEGVRQIRVKDSGSRSQFARVDIHGVPADGIVDTAADITIMGGKLFALVASAARLKKKNFKTPDKVPKNYDGREFRLDGCMEMEITFNDKTLITTVYIKMDAIDQLLLSEGVCRQLNIVSYHPSIISGMGLKKGRVPVVPNVRVSLVETIKLLPSQNVVVPVKLDDCPAKGQPLLVEDQWLQPNTGLVLEDALVTPTNSGDALLVISNMTGLTQRALGGTVIGRAQAVEVVTPDPSARSANVRRLSSTQDEERREKLLDILQLQGVPHSDAEQLPVFLANNHSVFSLTEGERGETSLLTMDIDTRDAAPRKQPPRRMPFKVREEVARQLKNMQEDGVIQPSHSPWSSPVVMVRKKDGSHRFCVDYRGLNATTKADTFPLPRIDDLLDQLGGARHFSTLDLTSGFWQIPMEPRAREKTAFVTPHGLYEFLVMPFGLTNAPAVFQRLMQKVLEGLNPEHGKQFVVAYLDDILVFSDTLQDHLVHLRKVIDRLKSANLKLKPAKCLFTPKEVEYLGHVITPNGLRPNPRITEAVQDFPTPKDVQAVRRFLGMSSYYRRFVSGFTKIAQPLHHLTAKDVPFQWSPDCEAAFTTLKGKLVSPPILVYPCFDKAFTLETDASVQGLGAVLSQKQANGRLHPVAYASRALNPAEKNYCITELETLAVVWGVSHFHSYLYGGDVTIITDHSAVKQVLQSPNPTGKHARWWTRVYGRGIRSVTIVYRPGRENVSADALSRSPVSPPPSHSPGHGEVQVSPVSSSCRDNGISSDSNQPNHEIALLLESAPVETSTALSR